MGSFESYDEIMRHRSIGNRPMSDETQMANDKKRLNQLSIALVDGEVARLMEKYRNPEFKKWYCKIVYTLGIPKVSELERRASEGKEPAKLFSILAKASMRSEKKRGEA